MACLSASFVREDKLSSVKSSCSDDTECLCLAAACIQNKIRLTSEVCTSPFTVRCDDNRTTVLYKEHKDAVIFCNESSSFLQWYTNDSCSITIRLAQQWTSGTRLYNTYQVARHDKLTSLPSLRCMKLDKNGETKLYAECDRETVVLPFFCKVDNIQTDLEIKENNNAGIIAGSVLPVLFIVALAVLGFFLYKKRQDSKTHQNKSLNRDPTTVMFATENKTSDHEINLRASKRPLPIPIPLAEKQDDKLDEDENTYSRIASVFFNESRNNFSNQCYNDIDFEGDNNSLAILNIENKQLGAKTEDDENYYSRIASAVFNKQ
ncbi:Hypothetical predicted protein [Mytilus galloprovincialis]|uniref:Uncharacterized protein n=1 Tax=Mytilus galloprovincialis TaxID=29158 RepID=A0A8B6HJJ5_MYTGA|nr:Hypothetical predicted protein [Mytilus galloprovincialis]